jgi:hypothetical protein
MTGSVPLPNGAASKKPVTRAERLKMRASSKGSA